MFNDSRGSLSGIIKIIMHCIRPPEWVEGLFLAGSWWMESPGWKIVWASCFSSVRKWKMSCTTFLSRFTEKPFNKLALAQKRSNILIKIQQNFIVSQRTICTHTHTMFPFTFLSGSLLRCGGQEWYCRQTFWFSVVRSLHATRLLPDRFPPLPRQWSRY